ncbi:MAG TPA: DegT/DnrJ/EryC1/StrS aminotransferase family protein, partial [Candidatus Polarisedimenticolia bacterium]|nr:DegT/DnrJ/EryC1/StrS aminotransferase family protein [Candidatus Polarisedimenticolia bacterium]
RRVGRHLAHRAAGASVKILARRVEAAGAPVPHSRPCLDAADESAALRVLRSGRLAPGAEAARLEAFLARLADAADAVALSSGTTALTLALRALGLGARDRVAIPSYACAALLHAVRASGATPLICDIEPESLALDPEEPARRGGPAPRAAVVVHPFGVPVRLEPFRARGLVVIEDCAQALGASDRGRPVGARGEAAVFSFAPTKIVTCGGPGGGLASPRAALVRAARDLATHDEKSDDAARVNGLMGDLQAAIGVAQIGRLKEFVDRRAAIAARYDSAFAALPVRRPPVPEGARPVVFRYLLRLQGAGRLIESLNRCGVAARRPVFLPLHRLTGAAGAFPASEAAHAELVSLPIHPSLSDAEVERVIDEVKRCRP